MFGCRFVPRPEDILIENLVKSLKEWQKVENEMPDNHPVPDAVLRKNLRENAVKLTNLALEQAEKFAKRRKKFFF
jgi:hypothetical protein